MSGRHLLVPSCGQCFYAELVRLRWALTGRVEELRLIGSAILDRDSSGIVVWGAAGVGKSRVAREALSDASAHGWNTRWVVGTTSARALPLGALSDWVGSADSGNVEVVRAVIETLTSTPEGAPVVIGVDDVALLDDLSTFVVHQIAQRGSAKLVLTIRDGDPVGEATQEVLQAGQFEHLVLQPLSREEITALVTATLGGPVDLDSIERLWRLTRGNVLYLHNIVDHEVAKGRLAQHDGYWRWTGSPTVPPGLTELVETRIGALPNALIDVIDALALAEPLELAELIGITGPAAVEEADVRGLITVEGTGVRLAHPLYGEVRRRRAAPTRLRRLRGLIATQLAPVDGTEDDTQAVVRRATLSLDSDLAPDAALLTTAAHGAVSLADMPLADRLADAAIQAGAGVQAYLTRAWALAWANPDEADAILAGIPTGGLTEQERVQLATHRAMNCLWGLADPDGTKNVLDEASRRASEQTRGWVAASYVVYWASMAQPAAAQDSAADVVFEELPGLMGAASSWALGVAHGDAGRITDALAVFETGYGIVARTGQAPHMRYLNGDRHLGALLQAGLIADAAALAEQLHKQATDLPGVAQLLSTAIAGRAALGAGRLHKAHSLLEPVVDMFFASGDVNGLGYRYQISDTVALAMLGATDRAAAALAHLDRHRHPSYRFVDYERDLARAWVAASQEAVGEAIAICLSAAETARINGQFAAEVMCLQTATQFGERSCAARLLELEAMVQGPRVRAAARFSAALQTVNAAELSSVSKEFEDMGDLVAAVDAASHAALIYRHQDRRGSAMGCSTRAEALAEQCGATTPALRQASERLPLTDREREIVVLLGQKLSSPAIAERLTLSRRTVEGHIYRAMAKTGVANREQLAALLPRRDALS